MLIDKSKRIRLLTFLKNCIQLNHPRFIYLRALKRFMMLRIFLSNFSTLSLCVTLFCNPLLSQNVELHNPLALPLAISGSFGEIRADHFHSGVDFRTNGKIGFKVYASESGFISRIKVSAIGFGKTIYIEHPNGLTTVYAHLDKFGDKIAKYVEREQYSQKSFEVELFPKKDELPVEKGDVIALSGNSGSSGGPHLHYEVRHTASQVPIAPLKYFVRWKNADTAAPNIKAVFLYQIDSVGYLMDSLSRTSLKFTRNGNNYKVVDTVFAYGRTGIGIEASDFINEGSNRCGFHQITQTVNNQLSYTLNLDSFSFTETKYVNSIIDYRTKILSNDEVVKLWVDSNNKFSGIKTNKSKGFIDIEAKKTYRINIKVDDHYKNSSTIEMIVKGKTSPNNGKSVSINGKGMLLDCKKEHSITTDNYDIVIPKDALFHDIIFNHTILPNGKYQSIYQINSSKVPIHKRFTLRIKQPILNPKLQDKYFIAYLNGKGPEFCDTKFTDGTLEASCSKFGNYIVAIDTIPPKIKPVNVTDKAKIENESQIKFQLEDSSGISKYLGYIDNEWALFEWDPKTKTLQHNLGSNKIKKQKWHSLSIEVTDKLNNRSELKFEFFW